MAPSIKIRPYERADADAVLAAVLESMAELSSWMPWCHPEYSLSDAAKWIQVTREGHASGAMYDFAILSDDQYCGGCGINHIDRLDGVANLGYWVRSSATGRGVAPAAVTRLVEWTFGTTSLNRLEVVVAVGNSRSQRVAEKAGATRDAVLKKRIIVQGKPSDAILYSFVRSE